MSGNLDSVSLAYMASQNSTDKDAINQASEDKVRTALLTGGQVAADPVHFWIDWHDDSATDIYALKSLVYVEDGNLVDTYLNKGGAITEALAPLLTDMRWAPDQTSVYRNLFRGLKNGEAIHLAPPAQAIAVLAQAGSIDVDTSTSFVVDTGRSTAQRYAENYMDYAARNGLPIAADLIDEYIKIDPTSASTWIAKELQATISPTGAYNEALLTAYRELNPTGSTDTSVSEPAMGTTWNGFTYPSLSTAFDGTQPPVEGWAAIATATLLRSIDSGNTPDDSLLTQLSAQKGASWAANYVRWYALTKAAADGKPLNSSYVAALRDSQTGAPDSLKEVYATQLNALIAAHKSLDDASLKALAAVDPQRATAIAVAALQDGLQPTNELVDADGEAWPSNYIGPNFSGALRIDLLCMGTRKPVKGDVVQVMIDGVAARKSDGTALTVTLTDSDVSKGYIDVPIQSSSAGKLTTRFTNADGSYLSPDSTALDVRVDTTAPRFTNGSWRDQIAVLNFSDTSGFASTSVTPGAFNVTVGGVAVHVLDVVVDAANNRIMLKTDRSPSLNGGMTVTYNGSGGLKDIAGNAVGPVTFNNFGPIAFDWSTPEVTPSKIEASSLAPARAMDSAAYTLLSLLNPSLAARWKSAYANAGLISNSSGGSGSSFLSTIQAVLTAHASSVEEALRAELSTTQEENRKLGNLNRLLGLINGMSAQQKPGTDSTQKLTDSLGADKYQTLGSQLNTVMAETGMTDLFNTSNGQITPSSTRGDLEAASDKLKALIDSAANTTQTRLLQIQSLMSKMNNDYDLQSNMVKSLFEAINTVVRNI